MLSLLIPKLHKHSIPIFSTSRLSAIDLDTLVNVLELLGTGLARLATKDKLSIQSPSSGDLPGGSNLLINQRVVVLQVGAQALELQRSPDEQLLHAQRVDSPGREAVGVQGKFILQGLCGGGVLEEEHRAGSALEERELVGGGLEVLGGDDALERLRGDVPQLLVLAAKEDDGAVGLGVEGRGSVERGVLDDLVDAGGRDGEVLVEGVDGAADLGHLEEEIGGELGGHCEVCGGGVLGEGRVEGCEVGGYKEKGAEKLRELNDCGVCFAVSVWSRESLATTRMGDGYICRYFISSASLTPSIKSKTQKR